MEDAPRPAERSATAGTAGAGGSLFSRDVPLRRLLAWAGYDWGSASFQAVITSFVFATYVANAVATDDGVISGGQWIAVGSVVTAVLVALFAAVVGQRADRTGTRKATLIVCSVLTWVVMLLMFLVRPEPSYLLLALVLLGLGNVFTEMAYVSYNAMLQQVSTPANVGRVSGFGWSMGYVGGIVLLLISFVGFIGPEVGWFGVTSADGLSVRVVCVVSAVWFAVFALPLFFLVPESAPDPSQPRLGVRASYRALFARLALLWRTDRNAVRFLLAAALYRDGLAAVFTFGAVLAVSVFGLTMGDVLIFGVAANVVAAVGALAGGLVEDRIGAKPVILVSLLGMLLSGGALLFLSGSTAFWVFGLALTLWVGPAQSSSRTLLARLAPAGHEGQMFGLYTTTGRAVSFVAPALFWLFAFLGPGDRLGIIGILVVLLAGAVVLLRVQPPRSGAAVTDPVAGPHRTIHDR